MIRAFVCRLRITLCRFGAALGRFSFTLGRFPVSLGFRGWGGLLVGPAIDHREVLRLHSAVVFFDNPLLGYGFDIGQKRILIRFKPLNDRLIWNSKSGRVFLEAGELHGALFVKFSNFCVARRFLDLFQERFDFDFYKLDRRLVRGFLLTGDGRNWGHKWHRRPCHGNLIELPAWTAHSAEHDVLQTQRSQFGFQMLFKAGQ